MRSGVGFEVLRMHGFSSGGSWRPGRGVHSRRGTERGPDCPERRCSPRCRALTSASTGTFVNQLRIGTPGHGRPCRTCSHSARKFILHPCSDARCGGPSVARGCWTPFPRRRRWCHAGRSRWEIDSGEVHCPVGHEHRCPRASRRCRPGRSGPARRTAHRLSRALYSRQVGRRVGADRRPMVRMSPSARRRDHGARAGLPHRARSRVGAAAGHGEHGVCFGVAGGVADALRASLQQGSPYRG